MKVFITGIGSDLGTSIARKLEDIESITEIAGVDMFPPRRYLSRSEFYMTHYDDVEKISEAIVNFEPDVIINFGVYEPGARLTFSKARGATHACVAGILNACEKLKKKKQIHIITRSSVVVYGFSNVEKTYDETSPVSPDTPYGVMAADLESNFFSGNALVTVIRTAPEIGAHVPHPLARVLTLPAVPVQLRMPFVKEVGFPIISPRDAVDIFVRACRQEFSNDNTHRILHAACSSNADMLLACKIGKKIPIFSSSFGFALTKKAAYFAGAPIDEHIEMFIRRGMRVDSTSSRMFLDINSQDSPAEILRSLYEQESNVVENITFTRSKK
ncbi:MAG: NAD(P)-dependent oxidoreductase [Acidimicrobiia bacterium]